MKIATYGLILLASVGIGSFYGTRDSQQQTEKVAERKDEERAKRQADLALEANRQADEHAREEAEQIRQAEQDQRAKQRSAQKAALNAAKKAAQRVAEHEAAQQAAMKAARTAEQQAAQKAARIAEHLRRFAQQLEERTERYLFDKRIHYAGNVTQTRKFRSSAEENNAHHLLWIQESVTKKQVATIQKRISQLLELANALALTDDEAMHREFDNAEDLTNQSFDLRVEQNVRVAEYRARLTGGNCPWDTLYRERGAALRELNAKRVAAERQVLTGISQ